MKLSPFAKINRDCSGFYFLCVLVFFLFSGPELVSAQEEIVLTGSWVGVYEVTEEINLFFVEWDEGENGRFQANQSPRSQAIDNLIQTAQQIEFTTDGLSFSGTWQDGAFMGQVVRDGENGRFYLAPLIPITTDQFDTIIGSYDMETEPPILISRADQLNQLFYQQGNQQIRLFPIGEQQFLTPLGDLIRWQPTHIHITTGLTPEATAVNTGVPTKNYQEALISIPNGDIALSGSLYLPMGEGPFPVLILLHGSGAGERHFYRIFADLFARNGIATLIYDKRGHGRSTGESETATLQNLADDAHAGIQFLAQMDEIDAAQIGVWGFSQGGRILPMVLAQNEDAAFAIAVSAPAMSVNRLNLWRTDKEQQAAGKSELARTFLLRINQFQQTLPWRDRNTDWEVEPTSFWQQVTQPILLVYGGKDNVVPPNDSAEAILTTLAQTGHQNSSLAFFPAANHDIMLTETAPSAALNAGVPTFAPDYFSTMITWIQAGQPTQTTQPTLLSTGEFTGNGRYAPAPWYTQFWFLSLLVLVMEIAGIYILHHHRKKTAANSPTFRNED